MRRGKHAAKGGRGAPLAKIVSADGEGEVAVPLKAKVSVSVISKAHLRITAAVTAYCWATNLLRRDVALGSKVAICETGSATDTR
jgi:hypothetical protein